MASAPQQSERGLTGQSLRHVCKMVEDAPRTGAERLSWWIDPTALTHLATVVFGTRLLLTAQHTWSTAALILAERGQSRAEVVLRQL